MPTDLPTDLPGQPAAVRDLADGFTRAGDQLASARERLQRLTAPGSVWEGPVAQDFVEHVHLLGSRMQDVEDQLRTAVTALSVWEESLVDRRRRLDRLADELETARAGAAAAVDPVTGTPADPDHDPEVQRIAAQIRGLTDEHEAEAQTLARRLSELDATLASAAGAMDVTGWLQHAEALLARLDRHIGDWVETQGEALTGAVASIGAGSALGTTVSQAAGPVSAELGSALGVAVTSLAAGSPASARLIAAARRRAPAIPLSALPVASFALPAPRRSEDDSTTSPSR